MTKKKDKKVSCGIPLGSGFTHILFNLAVQGYSYIYAAYSGSGDSGEIDTLILIKRGDVEEIESELPKLKNDYEYAVPDEDLYILLENKVYKKLEYEVDWYNNEGGGGEMFISTEDYEYKGAHYYNQTNTVYNEVYGKFGDS